MKLFISSFVLILFCTFSYSQNLPSLLADKNINATFSILAYDEYAQEWGIAVATNNIYVGNSTIHIEPGVGAFSVIAETEPRYATGGFEKLREGKSIEQAILETKNKDEEANYRQVSGIDGKGNVFAFTGKSLKFWNGKAAQILGKHYVVMGNQLNEEVLSSMSTSFENATGTLAQRLLKSLIAGQKAGGQISGKQSAALVVKGSHNEWYNQIDLRVDHSKNPIEELETLMDYHYGRIRLNQALYAYRAGNKERAKKKLTEAESMLEGWTGIYSKIAFANATLGDESGAVRWIEKGLNENSNWTVNLPAFYFLRNHSEMKGVIKTTSFTVKDWENALAMLSNLGRETELIALAQDLINQGISSSYLNFLLGRSYHYEKEKENALKHLMKAIEMDEDNIEAVKLLYKLKS